MAKRKRMAVVRRHRAPARRKSPARHVSGVPALRTGAMPSVVTRVVRSGQAGVKKLALKASNSAARASKLSKELNHEPRRAALGMVGGSIAGEIVNKGITKLANHKDKDGAKDPKSYVNAHRTGTHLIVATVAAAAAVGAAAMKQKQVMHVLSHTASFQLGSASAVEESKDKSYRETSGVDDSNFNSAGPRERMQKRRQMVQSLASNMKKEDPQGTSGVDLESYCAGLLDDTGAMLEGIDSVISGMETGILPLALLANPAVLNSAIPALQKLGKQGADALKQAQDKGETPAHDAVLALEGFDPRSMDTGSKKSVARQLARADKKKSKLERKARIEASKDLVKNGDLITWKQSVDQSLANLQQSAPSDAPMDDPDVYIQA